MTESYTCSRCGEKKPRSAFHEKAHGDRNRPVQSHCRDCRSQRDRTNEYGRQRYKNPCILCELHRKLNSNAICGPCNAERGLKQCRKCNEILPLHLSFYSGRATCIDCYAKPAKPS